jgi:heptosyltransferase-3
MSERASRLSAIHDALSIVSRAIWQRGPERHRLIAYVGFLHDAVALRWRRARLGAREMVAVVLTEHFGDIVAAEPLSRHVRRLHPDAYIVWVVRAAYRELVDYNPHVDAVIAIPCLTESVYLLRARLFDRVYNLHFDGRVCYSCHWPSLPNRQTAITFDNYYEFGCLQIGFGKAAGLDCPPEQPVLYSSDRAHDAIDALGLPNRFVAVHCLSNETDRNWVREKWCVLVHLITTKLNCDVIELGISPYLPASLARFRFVGGLSLLETAEVIRRAEIFVGVDSGPAHLANAVRTPGVIVMGHYRGFKHREPYAGFYAAGGATLLQADGPAELNAAEQVFSAVEQLAAVGRSR